MDSNDYDVIEQFRDFAANDQGIELPENIVADGKLHRFKIDGEKGGKLSGAYKLHLDGRPAGFVQNFKTDAKSNWKYTDPNYKKEPITPEKIKADAERKAEYERKAEEARKADIASKAQAAIRARKEWNNTKASDYNPYAERKGIQLHNARVSDYKGEQQLIIPLQDKAGKLVSLQRIKEKVKEDGAMDSVKMLFKEAQKQGAFSVLNKQQDPQIIAIAEGFATTASVIEDRYSVKNNIMGVMAVDAGNLKAVAEAMRELHPKAEILVFGDKGDTDGKGRLTNKGGKAAIEAAKAVNGYSVMPPIDKGDFNDYLTGKMGDITLSLENLINQSMGKVMANQQETELLEKIEAEENGTETRLKYYFEVGESKYHSLHNAKQAESKAEELGLSSIDFVKPDGSVLVFKKEADVWINKESEFTISQLQADFDTATATDIKERAELRQQISSIDPELDKRLAGLDAKQAELISDKDFKVSAYKSMAQNIDVSKDYADALPVETKQAIDKETQQRAGLESLDDGDKRLEAEANATEQLPIANWEAFEAGKAVYSGESTYKAYRDSSVDSQVENVYSAIELNAELKEHFISGFVEQHDKEPNFKSIEEAIESRLPHLDTEEYLKIAQEVVGKKAELLMADANYWEKAEELDAYSGKYYEKHEAFEAGQDAYRGVNDEYQSKDLPMALEQPHRHDNLINKEQFMLGFMEQASLEDGFKSIEEAFKTRLPHLNADEYLSIALETVDRTSGEHDYSELPKLPLRDSIENPEISFEVINCADGDKLEVFTNASDAMERAVEVNAETIKIREQGQFTTESWKNEDAEFVMPEGESFSKKYGVNAIENTMVVEQVIEPVVTESVQDQSTPLVEQTDTATAQPSETVAENYSNYVGDEFPPSSYDDYEPDYSNMPQDEDIDYEAHYAQQERFTANIMQAESRIEHESKFHYQVEDTGVQSLHAIEAQESAIKSDSEIINYVDDNQVVAGVFHKNGNEYINKTPEPNTPDSLSQAQKEDDFSHAVSIEIRSEQNLTLDRKTKSYPELDVKLAAVDSKEFFLIKGDEYKAQAQQSIAMNAALSKDYANALPQEIIANPSMLDQIKQKAADLAGTVKDKLSPKQSQSERPEVKPVAPTPATAEKVDISKPDIKAVEPEQKPEPPKKIPKDVADKYLQVDDKFYFRKNKDVVIFEDKGAKLETKLNSPSVAADLVRIAAERNWKEIKITGTPEFKSEVWLEAESRGIKTAGYTPTDIDRAILKERLAKNPTNTIEEVKILEKTNEKPSVRQMLDEGSTDKKMVEQHLKSHPELKETFEYLDALKKQLEKSGADERQIKVYMDTTKDGMAQMIGAGKYPEYQKTEHRQDTRQDKQPEPKNPQTQAQKEVVVTSKTKSKDREMEL